LRREGNFSIFEINGHTKLLFRRKCKTVDYYIFIFLVGI